MTIITGHVVSYDPKTAYYTVLEHQNGPHYLLGSQVSRECREPGTPVTLTYGRTTFGGGYTATPRKVDPHFEPGLNAASFCPFCECLNSVIDRDEFRFCTDCGASTDPDHSNYFGD
jgi:hypothetical protein